MKLCHVMGNMFNFIIQIPKYGGLSPPKKIGGQKLVKFGAILDNFRL